MATSKIINNLIKNLSKKELTSDLSKAIAKGAKDNINSKKNANFRALIKPKNSNNSPLKRTGKLFKSIRGSKSGELYLLKYGLYLNDGTKNIRSREFIPTNGTKQLSEILSGLIKKGV